MQTDIAVYGAKVLPPQGGKYLISLHVFDVYRKCALDLLHIYIFAQDEYDIVLYFKTEKVARNGWWNDFSNEMI